MYNVDKIISFSLTLLAIIHGEWKFAWLLQCGTLTPGPQKCFCIYCWYTVNRHAITAGFCPTLAVSLMMQTWEAGGARNCSLRCSKLKSAASERTLKHATHDKWYVSTWRLHHTRKSLTYRRRQLVVKLFPNFRLLNGWSKFSEHFLLGILTQTVTRQWHNDC